MDQHRSNEQQGGDAQSQVEERLAEIADLFENVHDAIIASDQHLTITYWNHAAELLYGWTQAEAMGQRIVELVRSETTEQSRQEMLRQVSENGLWQGEVIHYAKDGRRLVIEGHTKVRKDASGQVVGYISSNRDVTERRQAEAYSQQLLAENQRQTALLDAIFEADPAGMAVVAGPELRLAYYNPAYRYLTPDPWVDPLDQPFDITWGADGWGQFRGDIAETLRTGKPFLHEKVLRAFPDGTRKYFSLQIRRIRWENQPAALIILWDITQRIAAEEALRERETELRLLIDAAPALIAYVDRDFRYVRVNKAYERWFGQSIRQFRGRHIRQVLGEAAWQVVAPFAEKALEGEQVEFEQVLQYANAESRWVHITYTPDCTPGGSVRGFVVHVLDIGDRKQAEISVREEKDNFQRIIETANEGILIGDVSGTITYANQRMGEMLGYSTAELVGKPIVSLVDPSSVGWVQEKIKQRVQGVRDHYEIKFLRQDGTDLWVLGSGSPIHNSQGQHIGNIGMYVDISERKRAEERLHESQEWLRVTLASIGDGVIAADADGKVTFLNPAAERLTGWSAQAALGQPIQHILRTLSEDTGLLGEDIAARTIQEKRITLMADRTTLITTDGRQIPIEDSAAPILDSQGNATGVVLVFHDVTEKRHSQEI